MDGPDYFSNAAVIYQERINIPDPLHYGNFERCKKPILPALKKSKGDSMMPKVADIDQKERFIQMRAKDIPYERIAEEIGVSKPTLIKWAKEHEMDISNRRAFELEALQERYYVSRRKRIELWGEQLERLDAEYNKRDLSEIPTEKIFEMRMKTIERLKQEETEIRFKKESSLDDSLEELTKSVVEFRA